MLLDSQIETGHFHGLQGYVFPDGTLKESKYSFQKFLE